MLIILGTLGHKYEQGYILIFNYSNIFEYLKIIKSQATATYQFEDCGYDIKSFL